MLNVPRGRSVVRLAVLAALMLVAAPGSASAFSKAMWGPAFRNGVSQFPVYRQLGVSILEEDLPWNAVAPTRPRQPTNPNDPAYQWPVALQQDINQANQFHIRVMLQVIFAPSWANGGRPRGWSPHPGDFGAFATAAARHYPGVHLWMIWGEPTQQGLFEPIVGARPGARLNAAQQVAPHNYARLLDAAYGALKAASRANLVIGGSTYNGGYIATKQWIQNLRLPNGRPPRMDLYGHNPFTRVPPTFSAPASPFGHVAFSDLPRLAGWIDRYLHPGLSLFLSEWTVPTAPEQEFPFWVPAPVAANWIAKAMRLARSFKRIYALGWIPLYDIPPLSYGGLLTVDGKLKPGFRAFARG